MKPILINAIFIISLIPVLILAQDKVLLSEAIQNELNSKGMEAANKYFAEQFETNKNSYEVDMDGISKLSGKYANAGKMELSGAVMEIAMPFIQEAMLNQISQSPNKDARKLAKMQQLEKNKQETSNKKVASENENDVVKYQGNPRDDLERFVGLYGDPADRDKNRKLWVMVSCDNYLVASALWGDASPWWMKSESDKVFTYSDSFTSVKIEFVTDDSGNATRMVHDLSYLKTPLEKLGPIPDNWGPCVERPKQ